ncbi:phosphoserine phosphatase [Legionella antarctica]|uniref:phosphoserine phosphatase n=1 Tax=Legionella antarctica TaxID=2708020 RepID=A0A6F8TAA3_9GAMM|nr:HAD-IB family phosphatase [Legionella antarctica]BCA96992.1 phosphoserine phosphatase [Legionella antarctica]
MLHIRPESWMPKSPIDVFFFDCDSTLSLIEGIDLLASMNDVAEPVKAITKRCMSTTGLNLADYRKRLDYIRPNKMQIKQLAANYSTHLTPGVKEVIRLFHSLDKKIFIISGGIKSAIVPMAKDLGIQPDRVLAVDIYFNDDGSYQGFDQKNELTQANGKSICIANVLKENERSLLLGDGFSDWEAQDFVTRFVGYAGLNPKAWVQTHSDFYILQTNIMPVLALGLTNEEQQNLTGEDKASYAAGLDAIKKGLVLIKEPDNVHHPNS